MDNNKRLEIILKIREKRNELDILNLTNEEKEVLRRSLNYYEQELDLNIARANNDIIELDDMGIKSDNSKTIVPKDESNLIYKEYANIYKIDINSTINSLLNKIDDSILLNSLKEYALSLQQLNAIRENNQEEFKEYLGK